MEQTGAIREAVAAERRRCIEIAVYYGQYHGFYDGPWDVVKQIAAAIRSGGTLPRADIARVPSYLLGLKLPE